MSSVDKRIVEMQFDNQQFQNGIKSSMDSIDNLKKSLDLKAPTRSLTELNRAANSFSLEDIGRSVDHIASKFSTLGIIGVTALANITTAAMNAGAVLIKSLTIDPVSMGFSEYETKMGAIQTILTNTASKGTTLDDVNKVLQELNTYSDQTIYNFAEMAKNIGTFTAAGVGLDESATAIKGIANLAAGSGSTSQQAATAMYQLSQALAAGKVSLMDWNSVVNAGMGGELFQNALKDTAKQMGIFVDETTSFRESISTKDGTGWLTSDVLLKTLTKFANDPALIKAATEVKTFTQLLDTMKESVQSGWATSWEQIIGDKGESTQLLTAISDGFNAILGPSADARNNMLSFWNANGGREAVIEGLGNVLTSLGNVLRPIGQAFREVFPAMTGERLVEISKAFRDLTEQFKIGEDAANNIKYAFKGLFTGIRILRDAFFALFKILEPFRTAFWNVFLQVSSIIGEFVSKIGENIDTNAILSSLQNISFSFEDLQTTIQNTIIKVQDFFNYLKTTFVMPGFEKLQGVITEVGIKLGIFKDNAVQVFEVIKSGAQTSVSPFQNLINFINNIRSGIMGFVDDVRDYVGPIANNLAESWSNVTFTDILGTGLLGSIVYVVKKIFDSITGITSSITDVLGGVVDALEEYQNVLKAEAILKISLAVGVLAASLIALSMIDANKIGQGLGAVTTLLTEILIAMKLIDKMDIQGGFNGAVLSIIALSIGVSILAGAMAKLKDFQTWDSTWPALVAMGTLLAGLTQAAKLLSEQNINGKQLIVTSIGLLVFGLAIDKMAGSMEKFGNLNPEQILKGLTTMTVLLAGIGAFIKLSDIGSMQYGASLISSIAISMLLLYASVRLFGTIDVPVLQQGLISIGLLLGGLGIAFRIMGNLKMEGVAASIFSMGLALMALTVPIKILGAMNQEQLVIGLSTVGLMLAGIVGAMLALGTIDKTGGLMLGIAAAFIGMAAAVNMLIAPIMLLGQMSWQQLAIGLAGVLIPLLAFAGLAYLLAPISPALLMLSTAFALLGAASFLIGTGLLKVSLAMIAIGGASAAFIAAMTGTIFALATTIPQAIAIFASGMEQAAPVIGSSIEVLIKVVLGAIQNAVPAIVATIMILLTKILELIPEYGPALLAAMWKVGAFVVSGLIQGLSNGLLQIRDAALRMGKMLLDSFKQFLGINSPSKVFADIGWYICQGLINGIRDSLSRVIEAAVDLASSVLQSVKDVLGINSPSKEFSDVGMYSVQGLAGGLTRYKGIATKAAEGVGKETVDVMGKSVSGIFDLIKGNMDLKPVITPVVDMSDVDKSLKSSFGKKQGINVSQMTAKTATIAKMNSTKSGSKSVDVVSSTSNNETKYDIIINNPKPEVGGESVRKTLLKYSYGVYN